MADRQASPGQQQQLLPLRQQQQQQQQQQSRTPQYPFSATASSIINKLQEHVPNSTQSMGLLALAISGGIMLLLSGITLTATVLGLIFFTPIIIITSPIWVPVAAFTFVIVAGILFVGGFGAVSVVGLSWLYRYFKGFHPVGSGRIDYARSRIADTASHMKDYAREYGGYLQSKVKDAAPGA